MKRIICGILSIVILFALCVPMISIEVQAVTTSKYAPYANLNYDYSSTVTCGTIRYISQVTSDSYYYKSYWPSKSFGGYSSPSNECGTASISMALSYVGVNKTPKAILEANNGYTVFGDWGNATHKKLSSSSIATAMNNYINGNGKYSPPVIHLPEYSEAGHFMLVVGRISDGKYQVLDPWKRSVTSITISGTTAKYTKGGKSVTDKVDAIHQWYNSKAELPGYLGKCDSYPAHCTIKANAATGAMSLPCSSGTNSESEMLLSIAKGETFTATELILNDQGNHWYKIKTPDGKTAYTPSSKMDYVDDLLTDIKITSPKAPTTLKKGNVFSIEGTVKSTYNDLTKVGAYVYKGTTASGDAVTGGSATVNGTSYSLKGSTVDSKVLFNELGTGTYTYAVYAHYKNYYTKDEKTSASNTGKVCVYTATFKVTSSSTSCSHSYSSKVTTKATCTKNGVKTFTCSKCNASYTESIAATGHSYGSWQTAKNPTCVAEGYKEKICANCGDIQTQAIAATGHSWNAATCTTAKKCKTCGATEGSALGHSWNAATCTTAKKCKTCGATEGSALGHSWNAATCAAAKKCKTCGATEGSALGHSWNAATCTTAKKCKTCGATEGSALGHSWNAATCTTAKKCKTCGATEGSALGHSWKEATCSAPKTCATCGATSGGVVHTYDSNFDYKCNVCGVERTVDMTRPMVDMFRMYDPNSGEHFYTGSVEEKNNLIAVGWQYEGVGFTFPLTTGKPVHRLYDPVYGEHLYTMDVEEMNELLAKGWNYEGIAFNSGFENEVPQYRLHNPNATRGAYHFTASLEERDMLMALGWEYQGIGWYSLGA